MPEELQNSKDHQTVVFKRHQTTLKRLFWGRPWGLSIRLRLAISLVALMGLSGCSLGYLIRSGYEHGRILSHRVPIHKTIGSSEVDSETTRKLKLAMEVKEFSEKNIGLRISKNYTSYVKLKRPYVSWVLRVAPVDRLENHTWWFPIVGSVPYKGFFKEKETLAEARKFDPKKYDTYIRGVSAYSTLGWFQDPILSTMIDYEDHHLVELIIHENVHATIYIKNNTAFNERLASFIGQEGTKAYYAQKNKDHPRLEIIDNEAHDSLLFSQFISREIKELRRWYTEQEKWIPEEKEKKLTQIQKDFKREVEPHLKTKRYKGFSKISLNNARLLSYETYMGDMKVFEQALKQFDSLKHFIIFCKTLEKAKDPLQALKVQSLKDQPTKARLLNPQLNSQ